MADRTEQHQEAGPQSQLLQAGGNIIINGVSASDVVEITRRELGRAKDELTLAARTVAEERVGCFENRLYERFSEDTRRLGAFGDPDFQFSLHDAARAAASNGDQHTEDLLVDLLANRADEGSASRVRLATSEAIRAADKLSRETLNGLTAVWVLTCIHSQDSAPASQVRTIAANTQRLVELRLPEHPGWLEEADTLRLITMTASSVATRKPFRDFFRQRVAEYLVSGIPTEEFEAVVQRDDSALPDLAGHTISHPLKPGFLKLAGSDREAFLERLPLGSSVSEALEELIAKNGFGGQDAQASAELDRMLAQHASCSTAAAWWDGLPAFNMTLVGRVIAFVNARRHFAFEGAATIAELLA